MCYFTLFYESSNTCSKNGKFKTAQVRAQSHRKNCQLKEKADVSGFVSEIKSVVVSGTGP
jgi:hypothetical protein